MASKAIHRRLSSYEYHCKSLPYTARAQPKWLRARQPCTQHTAACGGHSESHSGLISIIGGLWHPLRYTARALGGRSSIRHPNSLPGMLHAQ